MRGISFRAFGKLPHEEKPEMIFGWQDTVYVESYGFQNEYVKLLQYTGLNDKYGVEIYEGDVVRRTDNSEKGEVIFVNGCFVFKNIEFEYLISLAEINHNDYGDFVEVIGNIYENPELLEN